MRKRARGNQTLFYGVLLWFLGVTVFSSQINAADSSGQGSTFFETKIRPVLVTHCYRCHSAVAAQKQRLKGGLRLDSQQGWLRGGDSGPVVVPGKPGSGQLLAVLSHREDLKMPPQGKLSARVIADFETWIRSGAVGPGAQPAMERASGIDWSSERKFWAFQPPVKHPLPRVKRTEWPRRAIDYYILARLETHRLRVAQVASRRELIRRVTFGLTGLPATALEIDSFLQDDSPAAYERVVDRLLNSPRYGERWGRHWLDVARYADDKALAYANPWPHAYRYRDWVVDRLNSDLPYDRFVRLQLAGDLLQQPVTDHVLRLGGLGFQGLGAFYHKGSVAEQVQADELDDRVDTLSRGLLGLTVACARCHDHKYDPIPARDYYSLASAYFGASWSEIPLVSKEVIARYDRGQQRIKQQEGKIQTWLSGLAARSGRQQFSQLSQYLQLTWRLNLQVNEVAPETLREASRSAKLHPYYVARFRTLFQFERASQTAQRFPQLVEWFTYGRQAPRVADFQTAEMPPAVVRLADEFASLAAKALEAYDDRERRYQQALESAADQEARQQVKRTPLAAEHEVLLNNLWLEKTAPLYAEVKVAEQQLLTDNEKPALVALRAELEQHKRAAPLMYPVSHGVVGGGKPMRIYVRGNVNRKGEAAPPGFLQILMERDAAPTTAAFTRLDLANAICSSDNPLTARVIVNRVWQHHFGRGIVATASNFGTVGERPSHPELLDTLAVRFMEAGWSLKWLHRELLLSAAYQLASTPDPDNFEVDPDNQWLWRFSPRRLDVESWRDAVLAVAGRLDGKMSGPAVGNPDTGHVRRTLYSTVSRRDPDKTLMAFDFPDANVTSERRNVTTLPQQQLFVLNSEFMVRSAEALAERLQRSSRSPEQRITFAYQWAYGRAPTSQELAFNLAFVEAASSADERAQLSPWVQFAQAVLAANEFAWID
ncbi:MAG: PSD1 and planctomycete cytochrome C domain-containing protein [Planctomycetota bacterium]|nr:PSD1 and planctomycete cytochrome C domain-containing protein [Planctomycetota bacterium]